MNIYLSALLVLHLFCTISSNNITENEILMKNSLNNKLNYMDVLIEDLLNQHWEKEESRCLHKFLDIINNVKNSTLWAVWVWDSMQPPAGLLYGSQYNLGNYDQCMNSPWLETNPEFRTQYCLTDIKLSETDPNNTVGDPYRSVNYHVKSMTKHQLKFNKLTWGVCVPAECEAKSIIKFVRSLLQYTYIGPEINKVGIAHCTVAGSMTELSWGLHCLVIFIISIAITTVSCTIINSKKTTIINSKDTAGNKLLKAFCLTTNASSLNKLSKNDINVLHGLRALTSFVVVGLHVVFLTHAIGFGNALTLDQDMDRLKIKALLRTDYTVDIFLLMSGLLRIKSYMAIGKINPFKAILKRYLRYVVTIGIVILCIIELPVHVGDGPIWNQFAIEETKACQKNWLISFLMLGNYVDNKNICYLVLWTVPCDFHLSVIATMLYWLFETNKKGAITIYSILMTAALFLPGIVTYQQNLTKVLAFDFKIIGNYRNLLSTSTYMMTHLRAGPYFIGMALGYLMEKYKPDKFRNVLTKLTSLIGIIFAFTTLAITISVAGSVQDNPDSNDLSSFIFSSIHRSIFTLCICCIIVICEYGYMPLLGSVLTWTAFIPISKISYGIYLVHCMIYSRMTGSTRSPLHYDALLVILHSFALISISSMFSILLYLFIEAPINKITDIMIDIRADEEEKDTSETTKEFKNVLHTNGFKKNM